LLATAGLLGMLAAGGAVAQPGAPNTAVTPPGCKWLDVSRQEQHLWCPGPAGRLVDTGTVHMNIAPSDTENCPPGQSFDGADCVPAGPRSESGRGASAQPPVKPRTSSAPKSAEAAKQAPSQKAKPPVEPPAPAPQQAKAPPPAPAPTARKARALGSPKEEYDRDLRCLSLYAVATQLKLSLDGAAANKAAYTKYLDEDGGRLGKSSAQQDADAKLSVNDYVGKLSKLSEKDFKGQIVADDTSCRTFANGRPG
jgi:hypothetical protein